MTYANGPQAQLGLVPADLTALVAIQTTWGGAFTAMTAAQAAAKQATANKDAAREAYEAAIRSLTQRLQVSPSVDKGEKEALGIVESKGPQTAPGGVFEASPVLVVDTKQRLQHTINFLQKTASPGGKPRQAKPKGVMGCEILGKLGDTPPANASEMQFLALDTATPYVVEYPVQDGGKTAHYLGRWVASKGDKGPWLETVSVTIGK